jgi:CRISPR-associated protein Cas2
VQNSVFEGEITESELMKIENGLKDIINENEDSIRIYLLPSDKVIQKKVLGIQKNEPEFIV